LGDLWGDAGQFFKLLYLFAGVVKKDDFVEYTEKYSKELFEKYKAAKVDKDGKATISKEEILAVNSAQFVFSCCG
jgi:hypothetical protein